MLINSEMPFMIRGKQATMTDEYEDFDEDSEASYLGNEAEYTDDLLYLEAMCI